jgi:capsular exopolysaccharide synthesis family protein
MELKQYFYIARKWFWLLILGLILGGGAAFLFSYLQEPIYRSTDKVLISQPSQEPLSDYGYLSGQQLVMTYSELLLTAPVLEEASIRVDYKISATEITVQQIRDTNILSVSVEDTNPERASLIANTIIQVLVEQNEELQTSRFAASEESLRSQIEVVQQQITTLQEQIESETEENIQTQIENIEKQISILQNDIVALQLEISSLELSDIVESWEETPTLTPETVTQIHQLKLNLSQQEGMLNLYQQLYFNLVSSDTNGTSPIRGNTPSTDQYQSTLALYQQIYTNLLRDYEAARLSRLENTTTLVSVEPAVPDFKPIRPKPVTNTLLGMVVGLMLTGGIVFIVEYLDDTIKSPEEISRIVSTSIIGYVPNIQTSSLNGHSKNSVYTLENPRSPTAEAFRSLRTNIEFAGVANPLKSFIITSTGPQEGKSTVAANLAAIMVQGGKRVILVDADMRRPFIHRLYKFENRLGLSEFFRNEVSLTDTFNYVDSTNQLIAIPSGKLPPNPAELLNSVKMEELLRELETLADYIILDCPPLAVTDPVVLSSKVDGTLFVVQPTVTKLHSMSIALDQLERAQARVIGIVMNNINRQSSYYYQSYYQSNYYLSSDIE